MQSLNSTKVFSYFQGKYKFHKKLSNYSTKENVLETAATKGICTSLYLL